jgi:hypothetical protein
MLTIGIYQSYFTKSSWFIGFAWSVRRPIQCRSTITGHHHGALNVSILYRQTLLCWILKGSIFSSEQLPWTNINFNFCDASSRLIQGHDLSKFKTLMFVCIFKQRSILTAENSTIIFYTNSIYNVLGDQIVFFYVILCIYTNCYIFCQNLTACYINIYHRTMFVYFVDRL